MKERLITSLVLIVILLLVGIIDNRFVTGLFIGAIAIGGVLEAQKLFKTEEREIFYIAAASVALSLIINPLAAAVFGVIVSASYIAYYQKDLKILSPVLYPLVSLMILYALYVKNSMGIIGWLIVIVALTDSLAYFTGKNFAKKFIPQGFCATSPNKSWEGVIGGVAGATVIGAFVGLYFMGFFQAFFISLLVSLSSVFGDLFESYLKRRAGVKDSGDILPGHGGILDRIDGYLFAAPVMFVLMGA
ncbi:CDP-archaeol synthase [Nautilia sp. PV-1]|jgi:phosphatidate cytidylyltransferase|uniref:phosphatidate cytidylyltransferase n=1 Tax=Nautilia sp. PV-1 TaxID=2579250 RepID=UPI000FD7600C|nr:phosphatidate cytidylyltransferase [Nautilia sp. PV-1]AZV45927.1 CDP-archaeol synthase [Nautilia sp. PV-1]